MAGQRPTALLVSPSLEGHRTIYCRVLTGILAGLGYRVVVAGRLPKGLVSGGLLVTDRAGGGAGELIDIGDRGGRRLQLADIAALCERVQAHVTILTEADAHIDELARGEVRLPGRVVGIFIRSTNYVHRPRPSHLAQARSRLARRRRGGVDAAAFHETVLPRDRPVDAALVLDERFATTHTSSHLWLPDIYAEFDDLPAESSQETTEWSRRLAELLDGGQKGPVVVYVGTSDRRRGYDTLLRLALDEGGCFLHCGRRDREYEAADADIGARRTALAERGALLETGERYRRPQTAAAFLAAATCVVLPYRQHEGSSGVMLQAVAAGRPVVVPDGGLMAFRVQSFGLGATYADGDLRQMRRCFDEMRAAGPAPYEQALTKFAALFSRRQVAAAVAAAVTGRGDGALLPRLGEGARAARAAGRGGGP
jgi:glycosyltransferase involved in cell wall biosynthesis